ncbi:DUF4256 domain-containing protein [Epilithonimonas lactis]|uniref:DUF4256 domain-containing protein n=1 Tax=Epilithonimonas lactis TaxID=421072 RepID=A0A085BHE9_9FLAO|nr:DUF4256 domain-containing protein [Epilithonimonas lactis]KFC21894.1 hypothetical protein IO89_07895 [Epilithonimonas lactis]SEQ47931.1 Protein of unknown function [Epilithonimonas lactis]
MSIKNKLSPDEQSELIDILKTRFEKNPARHENIKWENVQKKLESNPEKLWSLSEMERTEGEPDVVDYDKKSDEYLFFDCSTESPKGRRSLCYDRKALDSRKENKPANNAIDLANEIGVEILDEVQYRHLQSLGNFDLKTSSWVKTPEDIRNLGGAVFCDKRYNTVFLYHNGAESYYSARGFRGFVKV